MKKLYSLLLSIFTVILIASCGSTGPEPEQGFEPYRIGSFLFVTPTKAEWQGVSAKVKANDTTIASPENNGLTIYQDSVVDVEEGHWVEFAFHSDIGIPDSIGANAYIRGGFQGEWQEFFVIDLGERGWNADTLIVEGVVKYPCDRTADEIRNIQFYLFENQEEANDENPYQTITLLTGGVRQTIDELRVCN